MVLGKCFSTKLEQISRLGIQPYRSLQNEVIIEAHSSLSQYLI